MVLDGLGVYLQHILNILPLNLNWLKFKKFIFYLLQIILNGQA